MTTDAKAITNAYPSYLFDLLARLAVQYKLIAGRTYRPATIEEVGFQVSEALTKIPDPFGTSAGPYSRLSHSVEYASWGETGADAIVATAPWPTEAVRWIAVYAVTGGSEGQYVHVDLICNEISEHAQPFQYRALRIATIKTFAGVFYATYLAGIIAQLLGA